jgi:hypothetical protein
MAVTTCCAACSFGRLAVERGAEAQLSLNFRITDEAFEDPLLDVSAMTLWTDSTLLISDQDKLHTISVSTGKPLRTIGRRGDGPGEFRGISWASAVQGDTVAIFDGAQDRFTYVGPGLEIARTTSYQRRTDTEIINPVCALSTGQIAAIVEKSGGPRTVQGVQERSALLRLYDQSMKNPRHLDSLTLTPMYLRTVESGRGPLRMASRIPFAPRLSVQCSRSGVYWGDGTKSAVRRFQSGRVVDLVIGGLDSRPVSRGIREAFLDSVTASARSDDQVIDAGTARSLLEDAMDARTYESLPFYQEVRVGADETIWLLSPRVEGDSKVWNAYSPSGLPLTVVRVPAAFYLRAISAKSLWGVALGADDVPEIRSYSR